jgi:hypothetical protein
VARIALFVPDLLFGSNVLGILRAAGHEAVLCGDEDGLRREVGAARALVVDLTADAPARLELLGRMRAAGNLDGIRTIAFYSHVDADTRRIAEEADFDIVVPRSRMAREGAALIERALA